MATASAILWLRRIASCFFFTLAILFAALWVRSNYFIDSIARFRIFTEDGDLPVRQRIPVLTSGYEVIEMRLGNEYPTSEVNQELRSQELRSQELRYEVFSISPSKNAPSVPWTWRVYQFSNNTVRDIRVPHWPFVLLTSLLAIAIRPAPRFKFSLRDLFTLTTVAALIVGPLAFWLRSIR